MANETKWTPGPWKVERAGDVLGARGVWSGDVLVAGIETSARRGDADARLIAAAPEMHEALVEAASAIEWYAPAKGDCKCSGSFRCVAHRALEMLDAALAKAEGR